MIITIKDNKHKKEHLFFSWKEIERAFECDTFCEYYALRSEYNEWIEDIKTSSCYDDEEERAEDLDYALNVYPTKIEIIDDYVEYCTKLVEFEEWCSPRGIESMYKVVNIKE